MLTFFSCFCLFWHPALRLLWARLIHSMCSMKHIHTTHENVYTCSHTSLFTPLDDGFRICRGPASVNCWEVLTVATGYSPELGYKPEIMASSSENDQSVRCMLQTWSHCAHSFGCVNNAFLLQLRFGVWCQHHSWVKTYSSTLVHQCLMCIGGFEVQNFRGQVPLSLHW